MSESNYRYWSVAACLVGCLAGDPAVVLAEEPQLPKQQYAIEDLRAPTSPAFTILDVAPTNVVRPNTPRELGLEVLSAKKDAAGQFPKDFALETAPYWLVNHPDLTFEQYYNATVGQTILRSLSVSLATTDIPDDAIDGTSLGLGIRFQLLAGKAAKGLDKKVVALEALQLELLDCVPEIDDAPSPSAPCRVEDNQLIVVDQQLVAKLRKAGDVVREADKQRSGWIVEAAFGASRDYPSADDAASHARQEGFWLTASYQVLEPRSLTLLTVARMLDDRTGTDNVRMVDLGGRFIWKADAMPMSLSLEVTHRDMDVGDNSTSILGVLEYPINDTLTLVASFGKGLATPTRDADHGATIAVNFGFGKGPSLALPGLPK